MVWTSDKKKQESAIEAFLAFSTLLFERAAIKDSLFGEIIL